MSKQDPKTAKKSKSATTPVAAEKPAATTAAKSAAAAGDPLDALFRHNFISYASYVITDRAVPSLYDGLKPVQRRILHSLKEMDDGRFNKVANVVGHAMRYHPHGDASIGEALVGLAQRGFLIETQGNFGDPMTGDGAAAPRYIEARLTKFAKDVMFNPETTTWSPSYDGRGKEPVNLPVKFPLLLLHGAEGIAVGLSTKILPHNFVELAKASIDALRGKKFKLLPDFFTGGQADFSEYNDGLAGSRVKVRAKIEVQGSSTLRLTEIPYDTTTQSVLDSIVSASEKGKIKIKSVEDNTAEKVEVLIHLPPGSNPETTRDALYAFTKCEVSLAPTLCVIEDGKPLFLSVTEVVRRTAERTKALLLLELQLREARLTERIFASSLEKIFIEHKVYRKIEDCKSWEEIVKVVTTALRPLAKGLTRDITEDDITRLADIKIKRISAYDVKKADELMAEANRELATVRGHLADVTKYTVDHFQRLISEYGKDSPRLTVVTAFGAVDKTQVAAANTKVYVDRVGGFVGTSLKKEEFLADCSDLDLVIAFTKAGTFRVVPVDQKTFIGKDIIHVAIWKKGDQETIYSMLYNDGPEGRVYAKRFFVDAITRGTEYDLTRSTPASEVVYFKAGTEADAPTVEMVAKPKKGIKKREADFSFTELGVKGRSSQGNIASQHAILPVKKEASKKT